MDYIWAIIIGSAAVTFLTRVVPLVTFGKKEIPPLVLDWLRLIPPAVLASLLVPDLFLTNRQFNLNLTNIDLLAAIPSFLVAIYTRSMVLTVAAGMVTYILLYQI